jgi:CoA:oxalate CoA-transferase
MKNNALSGVKVVDLSHYVAGPYCTRLFADLGAEVIKVEKPREGDPARSMAPFLNDRPHPEKSGLFFYLNTNKKSITLDIKIDLGKKILMQLVKDADILVENFSPRVMPSLGLSYNELERINPGLIMTSISNFGQTGPYRNYKAWDITEYALSSLMFVTGERDKEPLKPDGVLIQCQAGLIAAGATMAALVGRELRGIGQHIEISIMECTISLLETQDVRYFYGDGHIEKRAGNRNPQGHPLTIFPCKDGFVTVGAHHYGQWQSLCGLIGRPELADDPRFVMSLNRRQRADEVDTILLPWFLERSAKECFEAGQKNRIPITPVQTVSELVGNAQYKARGFFVDVEHPVMGRITYPGLPFKMSATPWRCGRAPLLGEHNEEVYGQRLLLSEREMAGLREKGVI